MLRTLRGDKLEEIGRDFNISRFISVSSVVERMRRKISRDRKLRKSIEKLRAHKGVKSTHDSSKFSLRAKRRFDPLIARKTFGSDGALAGWRLRPHKKKGHKIRAIKDRQRKIRT